MDVRCEKCQTEYELDEARLKPGGVTVKCTNCGHMFKIRKRTITNVGVTSPAGSPGASGGPAGPSGGAAGMTMPSGLVGHGAAAARARTGSSKPLQPPAPVNRPRGDSMLDDDARGFKAQINHRVRTVAVLHDIREALLDDAVHGPVDQGRHAPSFPCDMEFDVDTRAPDPVDEFVEVGDPIVRNDAARLIDETECDIQIGERAAADVFDVLDHVACCVTVGVERAASVNSGTLAAEGAAGVYLSLGGDCSRRRLR